MFFPLKQCVKKPLTFIKKSANTHLPLSLTADQKIRRQANHAEEKVSKQTFLKRHRVGLLLRVYADKEEYVASRVDEMRQMVEVALSIMNGERKLFSRIDIVVWADPRFKDSDCGKTASAMRAQFGKKRLVFVSEYKNGDLFCGILNWGTAHQLRHSISHTVIASFQARDYLTQASMDAMIEAADRGARATGMALHELTDLVLQGRLANTCAMWDNEALMGVNGFDLRAQKPSDDRFAHYLRGWNEETGEVYYHIGGVEEVIPLARLVRDYGPCIAPILPTGEHEHYRVPDKQTEPENWLRHMKKMGTKRVRQDAHLYATGFDPSYLEGGVMEGYRHTD